jgi:hypothetical protein
MTDRMIDLRYFDREEFRDSWGLMSLRLLFLLDALRFQLGRPITLSPHPRALARRDGPDDGSQHNVDAWGECRAADTFVEGVLTVQKAREVISAAADLGITGIGVYPDWTLDASSDGRRHLGFHFDARTKRPAGEPALWGMVDDGDGQYQVTVGRALERLP